MRTTFHFRLYPTKAQAECLTRQLHEACELYNAALLERRLAWKLARKPIGYCEQAKQLKEIRAEGLTGLTNFSCCQDVLRRLDRTFKAYYKGMKSKGRCGHPRFKPLSRYRSFTFPAYGDGVRLMDSGKLRVQGIGEIKVKLHRPIQGLIKTVTLKMEAGKWYASFVVQFTPKPLPFESLVTGIDVGLESFAVLSDGTVIRNPRYFRQAQAKLRRAQRKVARRPKGSEGRRKAIKALQVIHAHVRHQRLNFHHQTTHALVNRYGIIAIENLNVEGLARGMLAKSVRDASWSGFFATLAYKAESAGRLLVRVDPRGTSRRCSQCQGEVPKALNVRWHDCSRCGLSLSRDHNSAREILRLGLSLVGLTWGESPCVPTESEGDC